MGYWGPAAGEGAISPPLDGDLAFASHLVVMSLFTILGLVGVVVVVAFIMFGPRGGNGS